MHLERQGKDRERFREAGPGLGRQGKDWNGKERIERGSDRQLSKDKERIGEG